MRSHDLPLERCEQTILVVGDALNQQELSLPGATQVRIGGLICDPERPPGAVVGPAGHIIVAKHEDGEGSPGGFLRQVSGQLLDRAFLAF